MDAAALYAIGLWTALFLVAVPVCILAHRAGFEGIISRLKAWLVIIPTFLLASFFGETTFFMLSSGCLFYGCYELSRLESADPGRMRVRFVLSVALSLPWLIRAQWGSDYQWPIASAALILPLVFLLSGWFTNRPWARMPILSLFLGVGLSFWILLYKDGQRFGPAFFAFSIVITNDIMAYTCGKLFGGYQPFPRLSPGKTVSGYSGGLLCSVLMGYVASFSIPAFTSLNALLAGLILAISGSLGDLLASGIKRSYGVKDFGRALGTMGGMLDRLDSLLGAGWLFYFYYRFISQ